MSDLILEHIGKTYANDVVAVADFNLRIEEGEFLILVGPSGCGKSTTLRMIAGLEEITEGALKMDGKVMNQIEPQKRDMAMVFQNYALYPHMSVYENMAFGLKMRKHSKGEIDGLVRQTAEILNLEHLLKRKPKALSGGEKQRVAMGRAMVRKPKLFLMDEPLSNLDAKLRAQMRVEIARLHRRLGITVVYVTHDQVEAMTLGTRIAVMKDGRIQQVDTPEALYRSPKNMFVAGFIGSPQMNFFQAEVVGGHRVEGLSLGGYPVSISRRQAAVLQEHGYAGKSIVLGVRPEDLKLVGAEADSITARVTVREHLGADTYLHVEFAGASAVIRLREEEPLAPGREIHFSLPQDRIHLFDSKTEERLEE